MSADAVFRRNGLCDHHRINFGLGMIIIAVDCSHRYGGNVLVTGHALRLVRGALATSNVQFACVVLSILGRTEFRACCFTHHAVKGHAPFKSSTDFSNRET